MVEMPSAKSARPVMSSRSRPVMAATDLTCPMFSAMRTTTTGRNMARTDGSKVGVWKVGRPNHDALSTSVKVTSPRVRAVA